MTREDVRSITEVIKELLYMRFIELRGDIVEQENCLGIGGFFEEFDREKFEREEDGFIFSSGEKLFGAHPTMAGLDFEEEIIEVRPDAGMTYEDVFLAVVSIVVFDALEWLRAVYLGLIDGTDVVF